MKSPKANAPFRDYAVRHFFAVPSNTSSKTNLFKNGTIERKRRKEKRII